MNFNPKTSFQLKKNYLRSSADGYHLQELVASSSSGNAGSVEAYFTDGMHSRFSRQEDIDPFKTKLQKTEEAFKHMELDTPPTSVEKSDFHQRRKHLRNLLFDMKSRTSLNLKDSAVSLSDIQEDISNTILSVLSSVAGLLSKWRTKCFNFIFL